MFQFLERLYTQQLHNAKKTAGDDEQVAHHRAYMLYLVGMSIFVHESATYMDVV